MKESCVNASNCFACSQLDIHRSWVQNSPSLLLHPVDRFVFSGIIIFILKYRWTCLVEYQQVILILHKVGTISLSMM